jgi:alkanesulfonate monooxygenase SsuD/methylene tetrahydromethanopterin reductase-like flavin-dependent oxidoreductase (luciferase family)
VTDLVEFLRERLADEEAAAKRVRQPYRLYVDDEGRIAEPKRIDDLHDEHDGEYEQWADGEDRMPNHIANWSLIYDPARVLREVEAKRRIVGWADSPALPDYETNYVLTSLALPYSDHEEFKEEWRP